MGQSNFLLSTRIILLHLSKCETYNYLDSETCSCKFPIRGNFWFKDYVLLAETIFQKISNFMVSHRANQGGCTRQGVG